MTDNITLPADWLSNHTPISSDSDIDQELLLHYAFKSSLKGNYSCPFDSSMEKCLDIGYSSGVWMMEMSTEFPRCKFYGIDPKPRSPDLVYPPNCLFGEGDFLKTLPYEDGSFDVVHIRLVVYALSADQRKTLFNEVARVTKKGGFLEFLEPATSIGSLGGPLLDKLLHIWTETNVTESINEQTINEALAKYGFSKSVNDKINIPLGKWANMIGDFSLAAFKLFITNNDNLRSKLDLHDEEGLQNFLASVEKECEQYKPQIGVCSGFAQKL